ncbi:LytR/AlgR family response regulator transcription factor [Bifidobacterium apicola]|uniref:LytR/AlgR family response regulator transcription factor n=1 Tax=Bifidobacterium apicola TaxID=3230739 RepID=UPI0036F24F90
MIRIAVVDDDSISCRTMVNYLSRYRKERQEELAVSVFTDGKAFVDGYRPVYDILLLDIQMTPMDGIEVAHRVRARDESVVIVFITSAPQYAINGYEVGALSYLLKPLPWFAFSQELDRSIAQVRGRVDLSILIAEGARSTRIPLKDIVFIESVRHSSVIHTLDSSLTTNSTLKSLEGKLDQRGFFRSNSCYLVNLAHVTGMEDQDCIMSTGQRLRVSRPRKKSFMTALTAYVAGRA